MPVDREVAYVHVFASVSWKSSAFRYAKATAPRVHYDVVYVMKAIWSLECDGGGILLSVRFLLKYREVSITEAIFGALKRRVMEVFVTLRC